MSKKLIGYRFNVATSQHGASQYRHLSLEVMLGHRLDMAMTYANSGDKWWLERLQYLREQHLTTKYFDEGWRSGRLCFEWQASRDSSTSQWTDYYACGIKHKFQAEAISLVRRIATACKKLHDWSDVDDDAKPHEVILALLKMRAEPVRYDDKLPSSCWLIEPLDEGDIPFIGYEDVDQEYLPDRLKPVVAEAVA